MTEENR